MLKQKDRFEDTICWSHLFIYWVDNYASVILATEFLKQNNITLTTTGTSGASTFDGTTLNIPQYTSGGGGTDEGLKPPHHGLLEDEAVADDLSVSALVAQGADGIPVFVEAVILARVDGDDVFAGAGERLNFGLGTIYCEFHGVVLCLLFGLTSRPRGQRECLSG